MSPTPTAQIAAIAPELLSKAKTAGAKVLDSMNNEVLSVALNDDLEWVGVEDPSAVFKVRITPGLILAAGGVVGLAMLLGQWRAEQIATGGRGKSPTPGSIGLLGPVGWILNRLGVPI